MNKIRIQDDLYEAVNGEWLEKAVIPEDKPSTGGFATLAEDVENLLMDDFKQFSTGTKTTNVPTMDQAVKLYKKIIDTDKRNKDGIQPVMPLLNKIKGLKTVNDLNENAKELFFKHVRLPFNVGVEADFKDSNINRLMMSGPDTILPDTTYYQQDNQSGKMLLDVYKNMAEKVLDYTDLSSEEKKQYIEDTLKFDALIAQKVKSQLEWADYTKNYNPFTTEEVTNYLKPFDFKKYLNAIYGDNIPEIVIVADPKAIKEMSFYFNEDNFNMYVHWAYVRALLTHCSRLSEELASIANTYRRTLLGIDADAAIDKQAYRIVSSIFSEPIGVYYGRTYFGEEAKKDITELVNNILTTWKKKVSQNSFLQQQTKEKAILKLSTIKLKLGYPDDIRDIFKQFIVNDDDSYYDTYISISEKEMINDFEKLNKPVDKNEWLMPANMVNACYDPSRNDITFPAAILQKPFYSIKQSISENLGGIGAVIAHEISHAFDNNGANFDELGNLNDWWTEKDYQNFKNMTKLMIEQWDGIEYAGSKVNGALVVSENIADNGGMAVSIELLHTYPNADFRQYFSNWAKIYCMKAKNEYLQFLLANDVHSPAKLRVNIQVRNFKEWYEAFDVKSTDQMYLPEDKRIIIW